MTNQTSDDNNNDNEIRIDSDLHAEGFDQMQQDPPPNRQRIRNRKKQTQINGRSVAIGMMVLGILGLGGMAAMNYFDANPSDIDLPIIHADLKPTRMMPKDRGGMQVSHQDKSILKGEDPAAVDHEKVVIQQIEEPILQKKQDQIELSQSENDPLGQKIIEAERVEIFERQPSSSSSPMVAAKKEIREKENDAIEIAQLEGAPSVKVEANPSLAPQEEKKVTASVVSPSAPLSSDVEPKLQEMKLAELPAKMQEEPAPQKASSQSQSQRAPQSTSKTVAKAPVKSTPTQTSNGQFRVQLGSVRDKPAAEKEWERLQAQNQELKGMDLFISQVTIPQKGEFFRIQAGKMSREQAGAMCQSLKKKNVACFVAKG